MGCIDYVVAGCTGGTEQRAGTQGGAVGARYTEKGEAAMAHRLWCLVLSAVGGMTHMLGDSPAVVD